MWKQRRLQIPIIMADDSKEENGAKAPVCAFKKPVFKKKAGQGAAMRKRARAESSEERWERMCCFYPCRWCLNWVAAFAHL